MTVPLRALIVEDSEDDAQLVLRTLKRGGYEVSSLRVETPDAMQGALATQTWDVVLSDYAMPHFSGPAALKLLKAAAPTIPFLIVSGKIGEEKAVEMMRAGARDYILKDNLSRIVPALERELREAQGRRDHLKLEEQYRQAQKMEALGQLAGGIAHDFNNLLTIINGYSELLLNRLDAADPSRSFLELIKNAGDRSASLTRQLLIFSRKQIPSLRLLDVNDVVGDVQKMLTRVIGEDVELITDLGTRLRNIRADPGQIEQVLFNLVVNARDAMPDGGQLTIRTQNKTLEEGQSRPLPEMPLGTYVMIEVADTGIGMTPEIMRRIFEPFFTTKGVGKGTGLGLATVFGIVKQGEGHITVESQPDAGTTFRIYLPATTPAAGEVYSHEQVGVEVPSRGNEIVLLAEDEKDVRDLVTYILTRNGYTVIEAKNGEEAIRLARAFTAPIQILITDVVMPEMGGFELAHQLREIHPETRILFVSGYPSHPQLRDEIRTGDVEFLPKPLSPAGLTGKVREVIDSPRTLLPQSGKALRE